MGGTTVQALTLADYQQVAGEEWRPVPGFKVMVRDEWQGTVTAVLKRTVVVQDPRIEAEEQCRTLHLKAHVVPLTPASLRWIENRDSDMSVSLNTNRRAAETLSMNELKDRLGLPQVLRLCSCGRVAANRMGVPKCQPCRSAAKARWREHDKLRHRTRPPGIKMCRFECGREAANQLAAVLTCAECSERLKKEKREREALRRKWPCPGCGELCGRGLRCRSCKQMPPRCRACRHTFVSEEGARCPHCSEVSAA